MAWLDEALPELRSRLGDDGTTQRYTDAQLTTTFVLAAKQVISDCVGVDFINSYTIQTSTLTISPDPTDPATIDTVFFSLVALKAACIAHQGAAAKGAGQAIAIGSSGGDKIDLRETAKARTELMKTGPCKEYLELRTRVILDSEQSNRLGFGVSTPVRAW